MPKITDLRCHKMVNSRGDWSVETEVVLEDGSTGTQAVPDGASKGENEAITIEVTKAVQVVEGPLKDALVGVDASDQGVIDALMIEMDGTPNKGHLGGNSILSVSLALANAFATSQQMELFEYISILHSGKKIEKEHVKFPTPVFNILNGGKHAPNDLSFQEFMLIPSPDKPFEEAMEMGINVYKKLRDMLEEEGSVTSVGDEGGFAPNGYTPFKALDKIRTAASTLYTPGKDVFFGMDVAAESFHLDGKYNITEENLSLDSSEMQKYLENLMKKFELIFIEDGFYERDIEGWRNFYASNSSKVMVVADDLVVTNPKFLDIAIQQSLANAVIVKPNQVGTLSETLQFIKTAQKNNMNICVSHRSGDTAEDTFIADLGIGVGAEFMKSGAPVRGERVAKYNRLLDIQYILKHLRK